MAGWRELLEEGCESLGVVLPPGGRERLGELVEMIGRWGRAVDLTAAREEEAVVRRHVLDCLGLVAAAGRHGWLGRGPLVDVGAGAGFPGLVVAVAQPELEVYLVESRERRAVFLEAAVNALGLQRVTVVRGRAEVEGRRLLAGRCDVGTARAVGSLATIIPLVLPLLRVGGLLLAQKGPGWRSELPAAGRALAAHGGVVAGAEPYTVPYGGGERSVVVVQKVKEPSASYPS